MGGKQASPYINAKVRKAQATMRDRTIKHTEHDRSVEHEKKCISTTWRFQDCENVFREIKVGEAIEHESDQKRKQKER